MTTMGRLTRIDARSIWPDEAADFTIWLSQKDNLAILASEIGMSLTFQRREEHIGPFRADIICRAGDGHMVVIENQLAPTDHSHLGQIFTYAAGVNALTMVWVAEGFSDEHRDAIDWLNRVTIDGINFFGVQIEVVQIDDSSPAPSFKAICRPNRLTKGQITLPGHGLYHSFWERLALHLNRNGSAVTLTSTERRQWNHAASPRFRYVVSTGGSDNPHVIAVFGRKQEAKERYRRLLPHRQEIESAVRPCNDPIDAFFHWTEESPWNDSRIRIEQRHNTVDFLDEGQWPTLFSWLREKAEAFDQELAKRLNPFGSSWVRGDVSG